MNKEANDPSAIPKILNQELINITTERIISYVTTVTPEHLQSEGQLELRGIIAALFRQISPLVESDLSEYQEHLKTIEERALLMEEAFSNLYDDILEDDFAINQGAKLKSSQAPSSSKKTDSKTENLKTSSQKTASKSASKSASSTTTTKKTPTKKTPTKKTTTKKEAPQKEISSQKTKKIAPRKPKAT